MIRISGAGTLNGMRWLGMVALGLLPLAAGSTRAAEDPSKCARISGSARYAALGYDHYVLVDNQCARAVVCEVWTDVDPEPHHPLTVSAGKQESVRTRAGSPAREFSARGTCKFQ